MPIYEYECTVCGHRTEVLQRMSDPAPQGCDECGKPVRRLLSAPAFQFKGSGWYVTDYADKGKKEAAGSSDGGSDGGGGSTGDKSEKAGDAKPAEKTGSAKKTTGASKTD